MEDVINNYLRTRRRTTYSLICDFILPVNENAIMEEIFLGVQEDMDEVREEARFSLDASTDVEQALEPLAVEDEEVLFGRLNDLSNARSLDRHDRIWLRCAIERWWSDCKLQRMNNNRSEWWWAVNLWGYILDPALARVDGGSFER